MRTDFMASAKQIAWRKKFAKMAKSGKFKKSKTKISRKAQLGMGMRAYQNVEYADDDLMVKAIQSGKFDFYNPPKGWTRWSRDKKHKYLLKVIG